MYTRALQGPDQSRKGDAKQTSGAERGRSPVPPTVSESQERSSVDDAAQAGTCLRPRRRSPAYVQTAHHACARPVPWATLDKPRDNFSSI